MIDDNMNFIDADKPEYAGGSTDRLEKTGHVHGFDAILTQLVANPDSLIDYENDEYSRQEAIFAESVKRAVSFVQTHHRPMTNEELQENRDRAAEIIEKNGSIEYWIGTTKTRNNVTHALNAIVEMAEQVDNNCFYFSLGKEKSVLPEMISEVHRDKLDRVHIIDTPGLCIEDVLDIMDEQLEIDGRHMICVIDDVSLLSTRGKGFTRIGDNSIVLKKLEEYSIERRVRFICNIAVSNYKMSKQEAIHALREYAPIEMFHGGMVFFD